MAKTTPKIPSCQAEGKAEPPAFLPTGADGGSEAPLLYLSCNNSDKALPQFNRLSPYHKKQAATIRQNAERFLAEVGTEKTGFLTLTFSDNVTDHKEASRRFDNFRRRYLTVHFPKWMLVKERQKRGAWHYHLLVDCQTDIRTGFDFQAYKFIGNLRTNGEVWSVVKHKIVPLQRKMARSACPALRSFWKELPEKIKAYGFGRCELMPIETTVEAVSKYVGKYISKHVGAKTEQDKGVRLFDSSRGFVRSSTKFQWNGEGSKDWRCKLARFAKLIGIEDLQGMTELFGSKWAYVMQHQILAAGEMTQAEALMIVHQYRIRSYDEPVFERDILNAMSHPPSIVDLMDGSRINVDTGEILNRHPVQQIPHVYFTPPPC